MTIVASSLIAGSAMADYTGLSFEGVDNGDIVDQQTFEIENFDDALSIYNKITDLGKEMLEKNLSLLRLGQVIRKKQNEDDSA